MSDTVNQGLCIEMTRAGGLLLPPTDVRSERTCSEAWRHWCCE